MDDVTTDLLEYMRTLRAFDSHEHLVPEAERLASRMDFTLFVQMYVRTDLIVAGMHAADYEAMVHEPSLGEARRFDLIEPYLPLLSQSSYFRAARIALKAFYGFDGITRDNFPAIGEALREGNRPGLYRRVLRDRCRLGHIVNQKVHLNDEGGLFRCNAHVGFYHGPTHGEMRERFAEQGVNVKVRDLETFEAALEALLAAWQKKNVLALKMGVAEMIVPSRAEANALLRKMAETGSVAPEEGQRLRNFVADWFLNKAREHRYVMAVHTGPSAGTGKDLREISPCHLTAWARRYGDVKFDMYHMGIPSAREAGLVAKMCPNVTANLCWGHVVAPRMVVNCLEEWLDFLPLNKIIGFGGDYSPCVEKVYGALEMTRENLAEVMARRIARGLMDADEARFILKRILVDNGEQLYGLPPFEPAPGDSLEPTRP